MSRRRRVVTDLLPSGRVRVRVEDANGAFRPVGTFAPEEAATHAQSLRAALHSAEPSGPRTFRQHGENWLEARAAANIASVRQDRSRWETHVSAAPFFEREIKSVTRGDAKRFRDRLQRAGISPKTQREVLILVRSVFADALEEQLIESNPFDGFKLPSGKTTKAFGWLYPDEEERLMGCVAVPVQCRIFYGVLVREGMRKEEALSLTWSDIDLERGTLRLDENKSDDPRAWALGSDVVRALRWWRDHELSHERLVFVGERGRPVKTWRAGTLREHLRVAGVDRHELHVTAGKRVALRLHDLRASFVTVALAAGRSETWVTDRTGHRSHSMVARYKRAARTAAELGLGWWAPLDRAIPEIHGMIHGGSNGQMETVLRVLQGGLKPTAARRPGSSPGGATGQTAASGQAPWITERDPRALAQALIGAIERRDAAGAFAVALELADAADAAAGRLTATAALVRDGGDHALLRALELAEALVPDALDGQRGFEVDGHG